MPMEKLFEKIHSLPNIPKVVQELIQRFNDANANADSISQKIRQDPVIAAKVLRLANSARYGVGRKVASIDNAVVMLGTDALRTLVVTSGMMCAFNHIPGFDKREFWRESLLVGNISKLIARHARQDPEVAFTVGMLHNIGEVLIHMVYPDECKRMAKLVREGARRSDLEQNQLGFDYAEVGAELARRWNFPEEIQQAIRLHVDPLTDQQPDPYACIVHLALYLARCFQADKNKEEVLSNFPTPVADAIGLKLLGVFEELIELMNSADDIEELLSA